MVPINQCGRVVLLVNFLTLVSDHIGIGFANIGIGFANIGVGFANVGIGFEHIGIDSQCFRYIAFGNWNQ